MADYNEAIKNLRTVHGMPMTIRLAIKALEKQIPKKVIKYKRIGDVLIGGYCPACGAELHISNRPCYCGQVLNWGDEE